MNAPLHRPVMLNDVLRELAPRSGGVYVDGTFGAGGYTRALLEQAPDTRVFAIDRDPEAIARAEVMAESFPDRLVALTGCFGDLAAILAGRGISQVDGIMLDLGVSSPQIDEARRGFSFRLDGPLDMRMGGEGETAADLVNRLSAEELADILRDYGEERHAKRIGRAIVAARAETPIATTARLAEVIRAVLPPSRDRIDPATRSFQALRIAVNDELGEIARVLPAAEAVLKPGGRLVVVTFHSLEDRIVKTFLRTRSGLVPGGSRHRPEIARPLAPTFRLVHRSAMTPTADEMAANPRSRSAKLRVAERSEAPAWPTREAA